MSLFSRPDPGAWSPASGNIPELRTLVLEEPSALTWSYPNCCMSGETQTPGGEGFKEHSLPGPHLPHACTSCHLKPWPAGLSAMETLGLSQAVHSIAKTIKNVLPDTGLKSASRFP